MRFVFLPQLFISLAGARAHRLAASPVRRTFNVQPRNQQSFIDPDISANFNRATLPSRNDLTRAQKIHLHHRAEWRPQLSTQYLNPQSQRMLFLPLTYTRPEMRISKSTSSRSRMAIGKQYRAGPTKQQS
jgi:hypothetical protein